MRRRTKDSKGSAQRFRAAALLLAGGLAGGLAATGCGYHELGSGRGVLLIAIDELRADHMSSAGYDRATTPNLDRLIETGVQFTRTFSTAPLLIPSHTSLLTGCYPALARRQVPEDIQIPESTRWRVPESIPRLSIEFLSAGYATAAFLDTESLNSFGTYDHGFQVFECDDPSDRRKRYERGGLALSTQLRGWLSELPAGKNWFAYLHVRDLARIWREGTPEWDDYFSLRDEPTFVPPVGATDDVFFAIPYSRWAGWPRTLADHEQRYDGALRRIDENLGTLFRNLELEGLWSHTTVSVVGSYGVQFGEQGLFLNSGLLSVAELHVPWILRLAPEIGPEGERSPSSLHRGLRLDPLASLIDVAPTLLDWEGLPIPKGMHGRSQLPILRGEETSVRPFAFASGGMVDGAVVFGDEWALEELRFDARSPGLIKQWFGTGQPADDLTQRSIYDYRKVLRGEPRDTSERAPEAVVRELEAVLSNWEKQLSATWTVLQASLGGGEVPADETVERLQEQGYLGELR